MTHIHLIGIGGTGLSAIAQVLLESGYTVSGSDRASSPLLAPLAQAGARVFIGHQSGHLDGADVVVRSSAIPDSNPEVQEALSRGIPVLKRSDFLGQLTAGKSVIAIAGTHGKTTTTGMVAWMLTDLGADPSFIVGGVLKNLHANAHAGKGPAFVIEADEYDRMFLGLKPDLIVITNVEHDHPDCFPTPADYERAFIEFTRGLQPGGTVIGCLDDAGTCAVLHRCQIEGRNTLSYGLENGADFQANRLERNGAGGFSYNILRRSPTTKKEKVAELELAVPGEHNVLNSLAAWTVGNRLGLPNEKVCQALNRYSGAGRRFEIRSEARGITVIDDYAHHPTEIRATLAAAHATYPGRRVWAVWQPHTYSRTLALLNDFTTAFRSASQVIVTDIYAAREPAQAFSAKELVEPMEHPNARFIRTIPEVVAYLKNNLERGDVLLVLSAGDADQVSAEIVSWLEGSVHE